MTTAVGSPYSQSGAQATGAAAVQTQADAAYQALVVNNGNLVLKTIDAIYQKEVMENLQREIRGEALPAGTALLEITGFCHDIKKIGIFHIRTQYIYQQVVKESPDPKITQLTPLKARLFHDTLCHVVINFTKLNEGIRAGVLGSDPIAVTNLQASPLIRTIVLRVTDATKFSR